MPSLPLIYDAIIIYNIHASWGSRSEEVRKKSAMGSIQTINFNGIVCCLKKQQHFSVSSDVVDGVKIDVKCESEYETVKCGMEMRAALNVL
jgi:hypothetical protein